MSESSTLLEFPCAFPIKAMGRSAADFEEIVSRIVFRHAQLFAGEQVYTRPSGSGNFLSVTIVVEAQSKNQLDQIYQDLTACEQVLMAL
jgi:putative lipoic acid-binding regulatory protein